MRCLYLIFILTLFSSADWEIIQFKSGKRQRVNIKEVTESFIRVAEQEGEINYPFEMLDPYSSYYIKKKYQTETNNSESRIKLATFCEKNGLWKEAISELSKAIELDPTLKTELENRITDIEAKAAKTQFEEALVLEQKSIKDEDIEGIEEAYNKFNEIIKNFPNTIYKSEAERELRKISDFLEELKRKKEIELKEKKEKEELEKLKRLDRELKPIFSIIEQISKYWGSGLLNESRGASTSAEASWQTSLSKLESASKKLLSLSKSYSKYDASSNRINNTMITVERWQVRLHMQLARLYFGEYQNYRKAIEHANYVLTLEPDNENAINIKTLVGHNMAITNLLNELVTAVQNVEAAVQAVEAAIQSQ